MIARITPKVLSGSIEAIPSKSEAHRALICAAFADGQTVLNMDFTSEDIEATVRCLSALGAKIRRENGRLYVERGDVSAEPCVADCGESGSTLRFLLPVAGALGCETSFVMHGRLPQRPMTPLENALRSGGCEIDRPSENVLRIRGQLKSGSYVMPGNISSQFITGMLLALSILDGESELHITETLESADYIAITLREMARFGVIPQMDGMTYHICGANGFVSPFSVDIGGDWSNSAFWLACPKVGVTGLDDASAQGDRRIRSIISEFDSYSGICIMDASSVPDLVPAVAAYACVHAKRVRVEKAERLRLKESDRIASVVGLVRALGGSAEETADGLYIDGTAALRGGMVDAQGDHRIAMAAAIMSQVCAEEVTVTGAEAVRKSYPEFWKDFTSLGGMVSLEV